MQARNIKRGIGSLEPSDKKDNAVSIDAFSTELVAELCPDDPEKATAAKDFIITFLTEFTNKERLHFSNVLENYPAFFRNFTEYNSSLPDIFKQLIKEKSSIQINQMTHQVTADPDILSIFGERDKIKIAAGLKRIQEQDIKTEAFRAKPTSIINILENQGYLAANEPYFDNDLQLALEGYRGTHGNVTVISNINTADENDNPRLKTEIELVKTSAKNSKKANEILLVTNNGTHHFIFIKIVIQPTGEVNVSLKDSKPAGKVSPQHKINNEAIVSNIQRISGSYLEPTILYTGEQGDNANCPFYSVREVVAACSALPEFKTTRDNDLSKAAASKNILNLQLAMTQKVARKKGLPEEITSSLKVDELGILHTQNQTQQYKEHRAYRKKSESINQSSYSYTPNFSKLLGKIWNAAYLPKPSEKPKVAKKEIEEEWEVIGNAAMTPEEQDMEKIIAEINEADKKDKIKNDKERTENEEKEMQKIIDEINATEEKENMNKVSEPVKTHVAAEENNMWEIAAEIPAVSLASVSASSVTEEERIIAEVKEAEKAANIAEVQAAEAELNAAIKAEQESKKTPREKIVEKLIIAMTDLAQEALANPDITPEEKNVTRRLSIEVSYRLSIIATTDLSIDEYKQHFQKIKDITAKLDNMNPSGWKSMANTLGKFAIVPALISKGLTGRWGIFNKKIDPSNEMLKFIHAIDQLEQDITSKSLVQKSPRH